MPPNTLFCGDNLACPPLRHTSQTFNKAQRQQGTYEQSSLSLDD